MTTKGNYLGEFEELVLLSVASQSDQAYGVSIMHDIINETGRNVNISAVHEVLKRLERKVEIPRKLTTVFRGKLTTKS
jgi:methyl coenzyme M reductase beta subunit